MRRPSTSTPTEQNTTSPETSVTWLNCSRHEPPGGGRPLMPRAATASTPTDRNFECQPPNNLAVAPGHEPPGASRCWPSTSAYGMGRYRDLNTWLRCSRPRTAGGGHT